MPAITNVFGMILKVSSRMLSAVTGSFFILKLECPADDKGACALP